MHTDSTTPSRFEAAQQAQLAVLLDALDGVTLSDSERRSLAWLAGWERHVIEDIAAVITRARAAGPLDRCDRKSVGGRRT